jgi:hypothetical protein
MLYRLFAPRNGALPPIIEMKIDRKAVVAFVEGMDRRSRLVRDYRRVLSDMDRQFLNADPDQIRAAAALVAVCDGLRKRNRQPGDRTRQLVLHMTFDDEKIEAMMRLRDEALNELGLTAPSR